MSITTLEEQNHKARVKDAYFLIAIVLSIGLNFVLIMEALKNNVAKVQWVSDDTLNIHPMMTANGFNGLLVISLGLTLLLSFIAIARWIVRRESGSDMIDLFIGVFGVAVAAVFIIISVAMPNSEQASMDSYQAELAGQGVNVDVSPVDSNGHFWIQLKDGGAGQEIQRIQFPQDDGTVIYKFKTVR